MLEERWEKIDINCIISDRKIKPDKQFAQLKNYILKALSVESLSTNDLIEAIIVK